MRFYRTNVTVDGTNPYARFTDGAYKCYRGRYDVIMPDTTFTMPGTMLQRAVRCYNARYKCYGGWHDVTKCYEIKRCRQQDGLDGGCNGRAASNSRSAIVWLVLDCTTVFLPGQKGRV